MTQFVSNAQDSETFSLYTGIRQAELSAQDWNRGKSADLAQNEGISLTDEQRERFQTEIDKVMGWFTSAVRIGRGTVADSTMEGQVFFGADALGVNLIDAVGTMDDAIMELKALMGDTE